MCPGYVPTSLVDLVCFCVCVEPHQTIITFAILEPLYCLIMKQLLHAGSSHQPGRSASAASPKLQRHARGEAKRQCQYVIGFNLTILASGRGV